MSHPHRALPDESHGVDLFSPHDNLITLFEKTVGQHGEKVGLRDDTQTLTYNQINQRVNRIAHAILHELAQGAEGISVALVFDHNVHAVISLLATLKTGKAYMPLAPWHPRQRSQAILEQGDSCLLVTNDQNVSFARSLIDRMSQPIPLINIDHLPESLPDTNPILDEPIDPNGLFSILHTSGSTGVPKAIARTNQAMFDTIRDKGLTRSFDSNESTILYVSYTAGASRSTMISTLMSGAALNMYDMKRLGVTPLTDFARDHQLTTMMVMPTILRRWMDTMTGPVDLPHLRHVRTAGEPLVRSDIERLNEFLPEHVSITISLVAGEVGAYARYRVDRDNLFEGDTVPVGFPPENRTVRLLGDDDHPVPPGEVGEFVVSAHNLKPAYIFDESLSEQKYKADPDDPSVLWYYTGDMGRLRQDGMYEFVGRKDSMVKVRGHQVVTNDLEEILREHPAIREIGVKPVGLGGEDVRIAAYYTVEPQTGTDEVTASTLREWLARRVPDYMLPSYFIRLDSLPLTDTGKVNRPALPEPERVRPHIDAAFVPPGTSLEVQLVRIWEEVLGISPVGIDDGFFDLGGHSLLASKVIFEIEQQLGYQIVMGALSQAPTVRRLAEVLREYQPDAPLPSLVPIQPEGTRPTLYCIHPRGGLVGLYYHLSRNLGSDQPVYGLQAQGLDGLSVPHRTIAEMAAYYISEIKTVQSAGPYHLAGFSLGGVIIHEMACQLEQQGEQVGLVALLDSHVPRTPLGRVSLRLSRLLERVQEVASTIQRAGQQTRLIMQQHPLPRWLPEIGARRQQLQAAREEQAAARAATVDPFNQPHWTPERRVLWANRKAGSSHTPRPFSGAVTFFRATKSMRGHKDPEAYWRALATGGITIIDVPGTHRSIMEEPGVQVLAQRLTEALDAQTSI